MCVVSGRTSKRRGAASQRRDGRVWACEPGVRSVAGTSSVAGLGIEPWGKTRCDPGHDESAPPVAEGLLPFWENPEGIAVGPDPERPGSPSRRPPRARRALAVPPDGVSSPSDASRP